MMREGSRGFWIIYSRSFRKQRSHQRSFSAKRFPVVLQWQLLPLLCLPAKNLGSLCDDGEERSEGARLDSQADPPRGVGQGCCGKALWPSKFSVPEIILHQELKPRLENQDPGLEHIDESRRTVSVLGTHQGSS